MQKRTRTKKSPTNRRSRKLALAKKTELSRHDLQQMSQTERFKRIYKFELKLKKAGWDFNLGEEGTYYATIEKDGLLRFLTHAQCLDYAVLNYSARKAGLFANVFPTNPTEQDESAMQSESKSPASVKCSGPVPEAASDSRPPSSSRLKTYIGRMERTGWVFTCENEPSSHFDFTYATLNDGGIFKRLLRFEVFEYAKRLLPMADVKANAGILPPDHELYDNNPPAHHPDYDVWLKKECVEDMESVKARVNEAKSLLEMRALHKNGFLDEARGIENTLDFEKAAEQLVDGLEFANGRLMSIEAAKTVFSSVMRKEIPAVCDIGACNVYNFLALADGPIILKYLCKWWDWNIQTITDDYGGEILYVITNDDWSYVAGFVDLEAAKTHYIAKALVTSRERLEDMIDKRIQPPVPPVAPPPRAPTGDDDIPF